MRVLIDTSPLSSGHAVRGIGTYTRMLAAGLEEKKDITVLRSGTLAKNTAHANIVHYPFFDLFFPTLPFHVLQKSVVTIHDVIPLLYPDYYKPGKRGRLALQWQKLALKTVSAVITDSHSSRADISHHLGIAPERIHVVYLAANDQLQAQDAASLRSIKRRYALPNNYVLYVGDINYHKNIVQLIKMLKFLPKTIKLVCVGRNFKPDDIPEWQWIETQLALSDVRERVLFINDIATDATGDLAGLYSGAIAYVQPSLYEGFGLPVLEAMQCRTPVISSNTASLPEVGGEHALYAQPTARAFADQVERVLAWSKTRRLQHTREAYAWSQTFSWQKTAQQTAAVYRKVLGI